MDFRNFQLDILTCHGASLGFKTEVKQQRLEHSIKITIVLGKYTALYPSIEE